MPRICEGMWGIEHRRFPRCRLGLPVHYKFVEQGNVYRALESRTVDFCAKGLAFLADRKIDFRKHVLLTLYLPMSDHFKCNVKKAYPEENLLPVMIFSEVAWCQLKKNHYHIGLEFVAVEPEHRHRFDTFIARTDASFCE